MNEKKLQNTIQILTVLAVILVVILLAVILLQTVQLRVIEEKRERLTAAISALEAETDSILSEIENRKTEAFVEKYARENLNMIKKGEIVFRPNGT